MACCSGWIVEYTLNSTRHMLEVLLIACSCPGHLPAVIRIALVGDGGVVQWCISNKFECLRCSKVACPLRVLI